MELEVYKTLACRLSQADIDNKNRLNGEDAGTLLALATEQGALKKRMAERYREIQRGEEDRSVLCRWDFDFTTNMKKLRRTDTQEIIAMEQMTASDRQITFNDMSEPTPADIAGKGATTIETGLAWAGRRPGPAKGPDGLPVVKSMAAMLTAAHAAWNGQRWLALSDEPERGDNVLVCHSEGEERLHPMDDVWTSRWKRDPPKADPAPKQLPPAPSPSTAELRVELDASNEILFADLAADLRSLGKVATTEAIQEWTAAQCREAEDYITLMDRQRLGVDVGDPGCPPHVAALPEYHRSEPVTVIDDSFDDSDLTLDETTAYEDDWEHDNRVDRDEPEKNVERLSYEDAWEAKKAYRNPIDAIVAESAIPEHIEDDPMSEPEPPDKPRQRKAGGKAKGKAGNGAKGRRKPAAE